MTPIAPLIEAFLNETLTRQRGASRHTRDSYALSFQLLFVFAAKRLKVPPSALTLEQLDAGLISAFLEHLEDKRKNAPVTRNVRLAAIKSFFRFLEYRQPAALEHIRRVLDERASHSAPKTRFLDELEDHMAEDTAEETLKTIVSWARFSELFSYDDDAALFSLENPT